MTRRMFSDEITLADAFLDMPQESQLLYFHLGMHADDDGFVSNPKMVQRIIGSNDDSMKILFAKKFLIEFSSGVCVIKHWRLNNQLRKDRYRETKYTAEKASLFIRPNGVYTLNAVGAIPIPRGHFLPTFLEGDEEHGNHLATTRQPRIGKVRLGKVSLVETKKAYGEFQKVLLTDEEVQKLNDRMGEKNTQAMIFELDTYLASKNKKYASHYATLLNWTRRKVQENNDKNIRKIPKAVKL